MSTKRACERRRRRRRDVVVGERERGNVADGEKMNAKKKGRQEK
jgi:hypothetical protein